MGVTCPLNAKRKLGPTDISNSFRLLPVGSELESEGSNDDDDDDDDDDNNNNNNNSK